MIEFEIKNKNETPQDKWRYTQPETGRYFEHYSYQPFMDAIRSHRLGNGLPLSADWQDEIVDQLCRDNPNLFPNYCSRIDVRPTARKFSFGAAASFISMLLKWVSSGSSTVDQQEADRRAAICITCPMNQPIASSCGACMTMLHEGISSLVGNKSTEHDSRLGTCAVCSCGLKAAVWFPLEAQQKTITPEINQDFPDFCWKKRLN